MVIKPDLPFWHPSIQNITNQCNITKKIKSQKILTKARCLMTFPSTTLASGIRIRWVPATLANSPPRWSLPRGGFGTFETGDFPKASGHQQPMDLFLTDLTTSLLLLQVAVLKDTRGWVYTLMYCVYDIVWWRKIVDFMCTNGLKTCLEKFQRISQKAIWWWFASYRAK